MLKSQFRLEQLLHTLPPLWKLNLYINLQLKLNHNSTLLQLSKINRKWGIKMKSMSKTVMYSLLSIALLGMSACSNMSTRDKNTAIGAGIGAVSGAVLTGGSALGTVGGAAVGGVIGNQINTKKK